MKIEEVKLDPATEEGWRSGYLGYGLEYVEVTLEDGQEFHLVEPVPGLLQIRSVGSGSLVVKPVAHDQIYVRTGQ